MVDIAKMTDAELRELAENANECMEQIVRAIAKSPEGSFACPRCGGTAHWNRKDRYWSADCLGCNWDAAGKLGGEF